MGYSVAYNVEQSISMVPPCLVLIEALMYEMVGVLCPWTKKAKLDHKKAKFKYFIMIGTWLWQQCWWQCNTQGPVETIQNSRNNLKNTILHLINLLCK
jgi:hypothetical protein